ncbi:MAG TPA: hypothetical protein VLG45_04970 [Thermodesulfobacteriota bacterium]|nr:hypothetical protein [Thermodesulfobacteriota bacterium]
MNEIITRCFKPYLIVIIVLLFSVAPALAQVNFTTDESQFLAGNPNLQFQDFSGAPEPLPQVCINPATSNSNDGCFSPGRILEGIEFFVDPGVNPNALVLFEGDFFGNNNPPYVLASNVGGVGDDFDIIFTEPNINAVGINAGCLSESNTCIIGDTVRVSVFGGSGLLGTIEIPVTSAFNSFLGINTVEPITEISILDGDVDTIQGVLNVWFGSAAPRNIPTLSELGMIAAAAGLMMVGVFFAIRKRSASINL